MSNSPKTFDRFPLILASSLILLMGLAYYFLFVKKSPEPSYRTPGDTSTIEKIRENMKYLEDEHLLSIKSVSTIEYLRTRLLYHKFENPDSYIEKFQEEILLDFPGERGEALLSLADLYLKFLEFETEMVKNDAYTEYQKWLSIREERKKIFGISLEEKLFPPKKEDKIEKFFLYTKHYCKLNFEESEDTKREHLRKARLEIYGDDFEELYSKESFSRQLELELRIREREMSILSEEERKKIISKIRSDLRKETSIF
ncbi:MAG: hypothetical protein H7A24_01500 [Leptospiraceae bacterium]|nr:hypothetical protein [Leptospiraceae bacterium]MCP5510529.1 hypothetical protein [Leptospiraceae bacterium]